jgi:hypothetical protein
MEIETVETGVELLWVDSEVLDVEAIRDWLDSFDVRESLPQLLEMPS